MRPALVTALQEKRIAGAALDVYSQEPLGADRPSDERAVRNGQRHPVSAPHVLHRRGDGRGSRPDALARCMEILEGRPVLVKIARSALARAQRHGVMFVD